MNYRNVIYIFGLMFFFGVVFGTSMLGVTSYNDPYSFCVNSIGSNPEGIDCKKYLSQSESLEKYMNFAYNPEIDDSKYLDCLFSEKKNTLDFVKMKDICLKKIVSDNQVKKQLDLFKVNCTTNYNPLEGALEAGKSFKLEVNCKGVVPATCYNLDVNFDQSDLGFGFDTYRIIPIINKGESCLDYAVFRFLKKEYDITPKSGSLIVNVEQPTIISSTGAELDYSSLIDTSKTESEINLLSAPEKEYYSCLSKYALFSKKTESKIEIPDNGKITVASYADLRKNCADKVLYATKVNMEPLLKSKEIVKKNMVFLLKNVAYIDPNTDLDKLINSLDYYYKIYETNMKITENPDMSKVKFILDLTYVLDCYILKKQQLSKSEMQQYDTELLNTLEINIYDRLYSKKNREPTIKEFIAEINDLLGVGEYASIKDSVITSFVISKFQNSIDTNENIEISATKDYFFVEGVKLSAEFKNLKITNYDFNLSDGLIAITSGKNTVYSELPVKLVNGKDLYIDEIKVTWLKDDVVDPASVKSYNITVSKESGHILYLVEKAETKKLLGFITIQEVITDVYNAETGLKIKVKKPWWDFMVTG
ncbi:MAG: hypothetical protein PHH82_04125 [Candidatus ainarchaeum sp.]|nr:hypothetical protein [Candidatus ainarchaeum sp.]